MSYPSYDMPLHTNRRTTIITIIKTKLRQCKIDAKVLHKIHLLLLNVNCSNYSCRSTHMWVYFHFISENEFDCFRAFTLSHVLTHWHILLCYRICVRPFPLTCPPSHQRRVQRCCDHSPSYICSNANDSCDLWCVNVAEMCIVTWMR